MKEIMIIGISLLALAGIYLFLICPRIWKKPDYSVLLSRHYAHRGLFNNDSDAPENSLKAFQKAVDYGYGIELDVQLSKDGIPVVFHDASLKRMCGIDGHVWNYTLKELQTMKLGISGQTIPTFQQVLAQINGKVPLIVEYKLDIPQTDVCKKGNELLKNYEGIYCIESFHPLALLWYRKHRPDIIRGQLSENFMKHKQYRGKPELWVMKHLLTNVATRPDFIAYNHEDKENLSRRICRRFGALSAAFTIKSQKEYLVAKDSFDLFIFDSFLLK